MFAQCEVGLAGSQGAHVHAWIKDGVHTDAVAEKGATGFALGGVHGNDSDGFFWEVEQEPPYEFIHEAGFSGPTSSGNA